MIVLTSTFLAAAQTSTPAINPRIGWKNYVADLSAGNITVSGETANGPRDSILTPDTAEYWEPDALPAWMVLDLGQALTINYVGLVHNLASVRASVKLQYGPDPAFATSALFGTEIAPDDDAPLMFLDTDKIGRYLRIDINGSVPPKIPVIYAGPALAMEKAVSGPYRPISMARKTVLRRTMSRDGQFLGQAFRRNGVQSDVAFKSLTGPWVRANFDVFSRHARSKPYFFSWNPQDLPREVGYVWTDKDIVPQHNGNGLDMDVNWNMDGIGNS